MILGEGFSETFPAPPCNGEPLRRGIPPGNGGNFYKSPFSCSTRCNHSYLKFVVLTGIMRTDKTIYSVWIDVCT